MASRKLLVIGFGVPNLSLPGPIGPPPPPVDTPPIAPSNLRLTNPVSGTVADIAWDDNSDDEDNFIVHLSSTSGFTPGVGTEVATKSANVTTHQLTGLTPGSTNYCVVEARETGIGSSFTQELAIVVPQATAPAAPTNLRINGSVFSSVPLLWDDNSSNEDGFKIYRSTIQGFIPSVSNLLVTRLPNSTSHLDSTVNGGTTGLRYYYRVSSFNAGGGESPFSNELAVDVPVAGTFPTPNYAYSTFEENVFSGNTGNGFQNNMPVGCQIIDDVTGAGRGKIVQLNFNGTFTVERKFFWQISQAGPGHGQSIFVGTDMYIPTDPNYHPNAFRKLLYINGGIGEPIAVLGQKGKYSNGDGKLYLTAHGQGPTNGWLPDQTWYDINGHIQFDSWFRLRWELKQNTADGVEDGEIRVWVNSILVFERLDGCFRTATRTRGWKRCEFGSQWQGAVGEVHQEYRYLDRSWVSTQMFE